jgi:hypothetical protein
MIMTLSSLLAERGSACLDESVMIIAGSRGGTWRAEAGPATGAA